MVTTVLQGNVNHCRRAQDLFVYDLAAEDCGFGVVVEPLTTNHPNWVTDKDKFVALVWRKTPLFPSYSVIHSRRGHVAVEWRSIDLVGLYIPPRKGLQIYGEYLDSLGDLIRQRSPRPVLVAGNFNAKSPD